jgi:xylan 1,4-beta-xylosidase
MMNGNRISVKCDDGLTAADIITKGVRDKNDINAIASKNRNSVCIMVWYYHDDDVAGVSSPVELNVNGIGNKSVLIHHYRVDQQFSNSFEKWKALGRPGQVTDEQYKTLESAGHLQLYNSPEWKKTNNGKTILKFDLPRQGVSLIKMTWE